MLHLVDFATAAGAAHALRSSAMLPRDLTTHHVKRKMANRPLRQTSPNFLAISHRHNASGIGVCARTQKRGAPGGYRSEESFSDCSSDRVMDDDDSCPVLLTTTRRHPSNSIPSAVTGKEGGEGAEGRPVSDTVRSACCPLSDSHDKNMITFPSFPTRVHRPRSCVCSMFSQKLEMLVAQIFG